MKLAYVVLYFLIYSFAGWVYESTICSINKYGKVINRGFLIGPYCPIYGFGAIINVYILKGVESSIAMFMIALVVSTGLEYITSFGMEKIFKARWWDYSEIPLNINGRVCLFASIVFGLGNVVLLKIIHPLVESSISLYNQESVYSVAIILVVLYMIDSGLTFIKESHIDHRIRSHRAVIMRPGKKLEELKLKFMH